MAQPVTYEPFRAGFAATLIPMWRASFEYGVGVPNPHTLEEQHRFFHEHLLVETTLDVAVHAGRCVGFVASTADWVVQLYIDVTHLHQGIGSRLLDLAKQRSNGQLRLHAYARNTGARRFYERHGFEVVHEGFEPRMQLADVEYLWIRSRP